MSFESLNGKNAMVALGGGIDEWVTLTVATLNDVIMPTIPNGHSYICTTAGTTGSPEPTWTLVPGAAQAVDGDVIWTEQGIDADKILGMGTISLTGGAVAAIEDSEFCDEFTKNRRGMKTGHDLSFSGNKKLDDTLGQDALILAYYNEEDLTDLRVYPGTPTDGVCGYSYYAPNDSLEAGGGLPAGMPISYIQLMTEPGFSTEKTGLSQVDFTGKVVSVMRFFEFT